MTLLITSVLELRTFTHEKGLTIHLKQGEYDYLSNNEDLCIINKKEPVDPNSIQWDFIGEEGFYSIGSDALYISIQDRKSKTDEIIDVYELNDSVHSFTIFNDIGVYPIPAGNAGGLFAYQAKNEKGHIIAILLSGTEPDCLNTLNFNV